MPTTQRTALILGATGGIGNETATALAHHGWKIRAFSRTAPKTNPNNWEWVQGDSMDRDAVIRAAEGVQAIVHAVNPPGYRNWAKLVLPMIDNTIAAAKASGARILLPGTIYNYGSDAYPLLREDSPQRSTTHKGSIRITLEKHMEDAAAEGVHSLIVRFGDFFGPRPSSSWLSQAIVTPGKPVHTIKYPGKPGAGHSWVYLPDAGEVFAQLMDREGELEPFARFHFGGYYDSDGTAIINAIQNAVGHKVKVGRTPWFLFKVLSPFSETMRELDRVRPLWETSIQLDNTKLVAFLGEEPHTPLQQAVTTALKGLGCIG